MNRTLLNPGGLYKRLFVLAIPMALQNILNFGIGLSDNLMVGWLGENALNGVFASNQYTNILNMLMIGAANATVVLAAQYWGRRDSESVKTITSMVFKMVLTLGLLFAVVIQIFGRQILSIITNDSEALAEAMIYIRIVSFGYIFSCMTAALLAGMRCVGSVRIAMITSGVTFVTDLLLNYMMIGGNWGMPAMGTAGAALSTVISRMLEFSMALFFVLKMDKRLRLLPRDILRYNKKLAADFIKYGFPVMLGDVLWGVGMAAQATVIGRLGSKFVMSANSIASNMFQLFAVMIYGTAGATGIIIGQTVGEGDMKKVKDYSKTLQLVFILIGIVSGLLFFAGRDLFRPLYPKMDRETMDYVKQFATILSFTIMGTGYQMSTLTGIVRAGGSTHFVLINDLIFVWLVIIPSSALAAYVFNAQPWVVFLLLKGDQFYKCIVALIKVNRFKWMKKLTRDEIVNQTQEAAS